MPRPKWTLNMPIQAVQHVRRMRGGAQSHLMRCADGHHYIVKFANNPQHPRVLVNDWLGTRLAEMIGLPVPVPAIVDVHPWLVEHTPDLRLELCGRRTMFTPGLSFGSRYVVSPLEGQVYDYLPEAMLGRVRNVDSFAGVPPSINGHATPMAARSLSGSARANASSTPASSIRDTFLTQASGASPTRHCAASSGVTTFMTALQGGTASSLG